MFGDIALEGSRWAIGPHSFSDPREVLVAHTPSAVEPCLRDAEAAAARGAWVVGYVSYDAASGFNDRLATPGVAEIPMVWFGVYDHPAERVTTYDETFVGSWEASMSPTEHTAAVASIRQSIESGDTYQANLTFAMSADLTGHAADLFRRIVRSQRKSFGALIDLGDRQIVSFSPELFLAGSGRSVSTSPMKGTAPRGLTSTDDLLRRDGLVASEKEQAGNVMIVDLLRNDLGRVSEPGSVRVTDLFRAERYPTVWQLTSTVESRLRDDVGLVDLFRATFPSGSVTGAPKVSTMEIIAELETVPRGPYCGALGYLAPGGDSFEFSVGIRTGVVEKGQIRYHVGGGITYDSMAGAEYEESLWKALVVTQETVVPDLMETMLYEPGMGIELLSGHMRRLGESAAFWEVPLDFELVGEALSAVGGPQARMIRLILFRGGEIEVEVHDLETKADPVELRFTSGRIDPSEPHWFHKTLDRDRYPAPDHGEVVLVNLRGEVTETNISNLMVRFDDRWVTPPVSAGCLPGVYRQKAVDAGEVEERVVTVEDFRDADEIAVTNAVRGWRKAVLLD